MSDWVNKWFNEWIIFFPCQRWWSVKQQLNHFFAIILGSEPVSIMMANSYQTTFFIIYLPHPDKISSIFLRPCCLGSKFWVAHSYHELVGTYILWSSVTAASWPILLVSAWSVCMHQVPHDSFYAFAVTFPSTRRPPRVWESISLEHHQPCHVCHASLQWDRPRQPGHI